MSASRSVPIALTIAGSDSSAGAGAQADLKTFSAFGVYGLSALTCVVAEMPGKVVRVEALTPEIVRAQIEVLLDGFPVAAIKTGLLHSAEIVREVARVLRSASANRGRNWPLVVDPVMVATSGAPLLQSDAVAAYERELFPLAALVTPNLDEAAALLGHPIQNLEAMHGAGEALRQRYGVPFLLKGGHLTGEAAVDLLFTESGVEEFEATFFRGVATHGTGCTYSAAIAARLATGAAMSDAIQSAKRFVTAAIEQHFAWTEPAPVQALNHSPNEWLR
ncbi:MAG: bifunctional hydroxymethylpyrimidine kinase/phosphomethylpyrimidine kinase [Verrucomicrobiota bacterium]|nr:bifunctional hydroxymethylpyrimidine kinase/phosphomethylpyrimidine kinase [Verrucomicrobiota bacterium]